MAADGVSDGLVESSQNHCPSCGGPVKGHLGPHGKKDLLGIIDASRRRGESLEESVEANEIKHAEAISNLKADHAEELARLSSLHPERLDGILILVDHSQLEPEAEIATSAAGDNEIETHPEASNDRGDEVKCWASVASLASFPSPVPDGRLRGHVQDSDAKPEAAQDEFQPFHYRKNRTQRRTASPRPTHAPLQLWGSYSRTGIKDSRQCFFVSGISEDCTSEHVRKYCKDKNVQATGSISQLGNAIR